MNKYLVKIAAKISDTPKNPNYVRAVGRGFLETIPGGMVGTLGAYGLTRNLNAAQIGSVAGQVAGAVHGYRASMKNQAEEEYLSKHR